MPPELQPPGRAETPSGLISLPPTVPMAGGTRAGARPTAAAGSREQQRAAGLRAPRRTGGGPGGRAGRGVRPRDAPHKGRHRRGGGGTAGWGRTG